AVTPDALTIETGKGKSTETRTLPIAEVKDVSKGHKTRNIVLITTAVLFGVCAASLASYDEGHTLPEATPPASEPPRPDPPSAPVGPTLPPVDSLPSMP